MEKRRGQHSGPGREPLGYRRAKPGTRRGMATTQQPPPSPQAEFVRAISRLDATALVVGSMIGSGIFIFSAEILRGVLARSMLLACSVRLVVQSHVWSV